jgi:2-iminobutanoate/2-iminopropanoate deaminase
VEKPSFSNPDTVAAPDGHFSQSATVSANSRFLFISGQVPRALDGSNVGVGDMRSQAEQVFMNLELILRAHRADFSNVAKVTLYTTRIDLVQDIMEVRKRFYKAAQPASTLVEVSALGDPDWWLEVEMTAVI